MSNPVAANRRASAWTFETSGQVASITSRSRCLRLAAHRRRDAVGREDHGLALRHLVELVDEDRPALLERAHDVGVVDDLLAHVDRRARGPRARARRSRPRARRRRTRRAARPARPPASRVRWPTPRPASKRGAARDRRSRRPVSVRSGRCSSRRLVSSTTRKRHQRPSPSGGRQPGRLHVDGERAAAVERPAPLPHHQPLARGDRRDVHAQAPPRRSTPARIVGSSHAVVPVGPRSSVASTMSPGSSSGSSAPQNPAIRIGRLPPAADELRRAGSATRTHADATDVGPGRTGAHRARLERQRREHDDLIRALPGLESSECSTDASAVLI